MNLSSIDVSGFDTSKVTDMNRMFSGCEKLKSIDVSKFNTSNVTSMIGMFHMCQSLDELDLSSFNLTNLQNDLNDSDDYFIHEHEGMKFKTPLNYKENTSFQHCYSNNADQLYWQDNNGTVYEYYPKLSYSITLTLKSLPDDDYYECVMPAEKNTVLTVASNKCKVKVTSADAENPTVAYTKSTNSKVKTITVPDTVTVEGITYKVTSVAASALANNKKVTKVTIGKNVTSIGKNALKNCKKLKTVTIKSTNLKTIGANTFSGCKNLKTITIKSTKLTKNTVGTLVNESYYLERDRVVRLQPGDELRLADTENVFKLG